MKKNILLILISGLIFTSIGVYATTLINSNQVSYKDTTLDLALDDLFSKASTKYLDKLTCTGTCIASQFQVGDYVSMTPTLTSYKILAADTGYSSDQTINPSEINLWRIISINSDGTVDAVSEYVSSTDVYFSGKSGYQNYVGTLNKIAASYTNPSYVIRTRPMGYGAATQYITDTTALDQTTAPWTGATSSSTTLAAEQQGGGDIGYEYDYNLVKNVIGTAVAKKVGTTTATAYWLASRRYYYSYSTGWSFIARYVFANGSTYSSHLYDYDSSSFYSYSYSKAIRPIITLKSGLTVSGGSGTSSSPWTLN